MATVRVGVASAQETLRAGGGGCPEQDQQPTTGHAPGFIMATDLPTANTEGAGHRGNDSFAVLRGSKVTSNLKSHTG